MANPELAQLMNCCEEYSEFSNIIYFDNNSMFAEFVLISPKAGCDFGAEINIYLRDRSVVQVLLGAATYEQLESLAFGYLLLAPNIITRLSVVTYQDNEIYIFTGSNADV